MEDKIVELENKLNEMEKKYNQTCEVLEELVYHFILEFGKEELRMDHSHSLVPRNNKKVLLKSYLYGYDYHEVIFGENYRSILGLNSLENYEVEKRLDEIIEDMSNEDVENIIKKIFNQQYNETIVHLDADIYKKRKKLKKGIEYGRWINTDASDILQRGSIVLWAIFDRVNKKKQDEIKEFEKATIKPYINKYNEISQQIEEQEKAEKFEKIKEKERELERMKKELDV